MQGKLIWPDLNNVAFARPSGRRGKRFCPDAARGVWDAYERDHRLQHGLSGCLFAGGPGTQRRLFAERKSGSSLYRRSDLPQDQKAPPASAASGSHPTSHAACRKHMADNPMGCGAESVPGENPGAQRRTDRHTPYIGLGRQGCLKRSHPAFFCPARFLQQHGCLSPLILRQSFSLNHSF